MSQETRDVGSVLPPKRIKDNLLLVDESLDIDPSDDKMVCYFLPHFPRLSLTIHL